jgi:hypothetical protein
MTDELNTEGLHELMEGRGPYVLLTRDHAHAVVDSPDEAFALLTEALCACLQEIEDPTQRGEVAAELGRRIGRALADVGS